MTTKKENDVFYEGVCTVLSACEVMDHIDPCDLDVDCAELLAYAEENEPLFDGVVRWLVDAEGDV